ncbi:MAG: LLM class flavin-dependent oxidoreductase [Solirubrobacteraceae bacterium]|nr:LLM class flavin-dependent oxidoreductase [Solirubrobacteraceae bacterium]
MDLKLSVLDQTPVPEGVSGSEALQQTLDLARHADALGYHRYWVSEHHGGLSVAGPAPEALVPAIASITSRLRVGSGGVMLPHYSPFKVAEQFSLLAGLFPGRIDLGLGRASGTDALTAFALQRDRTSQAMHDDFPAQLGELLGYLENTLPSNHAFARLATSLPGLPEAPTPWLLGSSPQSGIWAAELGLPYAFADFINPKGELIAKSYVNEFQPGRRLDAAEVAVAAWVLVADTAEEAQFLSLSHRVGMNALRRGRPMPFFPPEKAEKMLRAEGEDPTKPPPGRRMILGTPSQVREQLEDLARGYGASEVIVVTITHDHEARKRSYELLATEFALESGTRVASTNAAA